MSLRRRRGNDFTDSLNSFRVTLDSLNSEADSQSQDSLDDALHNNAFKNANPSNLSEGVAEEYVCSIYDKSRMDQSLYDSEYRVSQSFSTEKPNVLNDAIYLSDNSLDESTKYESLCLYDSIKQDKNVQQLGNKPVITKIETPPAILMNILSPYLSKAGPSNNSDIYGRDGTYHIDDISQKPEAASEDDLKSKCGNTEDEVCDSLCSKDLEQHCNDISGLSYSNDTHSYTDQKISDTKKEGTEEMSSSFAEILSSFINELCRANKSVRNSEDLRRLSENFNACPRNFTERLITIIEESTTNSEAEIGINSAVDLSRLTEEFRTMCKFIEDETMPQWPDSPVTNTPFNAKKTPVIKDTTNGKLQNKISYDLLRRTQDGTNTSLSEMHNITFEELEARCKILFSELDRKHQLESQTQKQPVIDDKEAAMSMENIRILSERQLASLDSSLNNSSNTFCNGDTGSTTVDTEERCKSYYRTPQHFPKNVETRKSIGDFEELEDSPCHLLDTLKSGKLLHLDDLQKTLLLQIEEKRQRCLDTAKVIMEIDGNNESSGDQKLLQQPREGAITEPQASTPNSKKFFNTLVSCQKYGSYLDTHKSFFTELQNKCQPVSESTCITNGKTLPKTKLFVTPAKMPQIVISSSTPVSKRVPKAKLFVTPEKELDKGIRKKKPMYFSSMHKSNSDLTERTSKKTYISPSIECFSGLNYENIQSPVGKYIKGIDTTLIQNYQRLRSPNTPIRKNVSAAKTINLSTNEKENVPADRKVLPKINYNLSL